MQVLSHITHCPVLTMQMSSALHNYTTPSPVLYHYHCPVLCTITTQPSHSPVLTMQMSSALHNYTTQPSPVLYHYHCCCFLQSLNQKWNLDKVTSLLQNDRNCFVQHKLCSAKEISYLENKFRSKSQSLWNSHTRVTCSS